jgi:1-acyl-sn-glycerol-3-phosphate acyltransferase
MIKTIAKTVLKIFGWQISFSLPPRDKYVLVGAPHTSNWDFPLGLLGMWACGLRFNWVGKHTLFKGPLGPIMRAIGGIPLDRLGSIGFLKKVIDLFAKRDQFVMAIAPEGTRSLTKQWKEGFYRIALAASVPIALGYIDYPCKRIGIDRMFEPSGDIEADFMILEEYYHDKIGRHPEKQGPVRIRGCSSEKVERRNTES